MALQFFSKKAPQRLAHFFLELGWIGAGFPVHAAQSFENYFFGGLQNFFAFLRAHEAARDKIRPGDQLRPTADGSPSRPAPCRLPIDGGGRG